MTGGNSHTNAVLCGTGARTPVGLSGPSTAAAVRGGISVMAEHPYMIDRAGAPMIVCRDPLLPLTISGVDRYVELARGPALEALAPLKQVYGAEIDVDLIIAVPESRPGRPADLERVFADRLAGELAHEARIQHASCYALGNAGGLYCFEHALHRIRARTTDFCLVGGVETYLEAETLEWLDDREQLHSEATIWGFCPSEAAGFCLVGRSDVSLWPEQSVLSLLSAASGMEANRNDTETVCIGAGLTDAFRGALSPLPDSLKVDHSICDMNGDPYRGNEFGFAALRCSQWFSEFADFDTPADCWGDVGAASGPLFAMLATYAAKKRYSRGETTMLWASSDGGLRSAAVLRTVSG